VCSDQLTHVCGAKGFIKGIHVIYLHYTIVIYKFCYNQKQRVESIMYENKIIRKIMWLFFVSRFQGPTGITRAQALCTPFLKVKGRGRGESPPPPSFERAKSI
jgi:hypothetical protein